jgi:uncharacterized protein YutD
MVLNNFYKKNAILIQNKSLYIRGMINLKFSAEYTSSQYTDIYTRYGYLIEDYWPSYTSCTRFYTDKVHFDQ